MCGLLGSGLAIAGTAAVAGELNGTASAATATPAGRSTGLPVPAAPPRTKVPTASNASQTPDADVRPVTIEIPSIKVDTRIEMLGIADDGTLETPTDAKEAGWYTGSALPGEPGPVVVAGHVDSYTGPAVFVHLQQVKVGASVTITLTGGSRVVYRVQSVERYAKNAFPTESVYGPRPDSELRLITCGGAFVDGHYVDDVIVFAQLDTTAGKA